MQSAAVPFPAIVGNIGRPILIFLGAIGLALTLCLNNEIVPLILGASCFILLVGFSRFNIANLMIGMILADHLCQFFKRLVFSLSDEPPLEIYYGFQVMPSLILLMALASSFVVISKYKLPTSTKALAVYVAIAVVMTLTSPRGGTFSGRLGGINQQLIPFIALFVGIAVPVSAWKRVARLYFVLIIVSTAYGIFQWFHGFTQFERTWAIRTHDVSIQGRKVYDLIIGLSTDFRSFSYYSDHTMWGFFLVMSLLFIVACVPVGAFPKKLLWVAVPVALTGLLTAGTRTLWIALIGAVVVHRVLSIKGLRRTGLVLATVFGSFALVLSLGPYLIKNVHIALTSNLLLNRYLTVGTIEARISAPELFIKILPSHFLFGDGFGSSYNYRGLDSSLQFAAEEYSHNMLVDLLLYTGGPGVIAILIFLYTWVREAFWTIKHTTPRMAESLRWMVACAVGQMMTGALQSNNFMTIYFFLMAGTATGEWIRVKKEQALLLQPVRY